MRAVWRFTSRGSVCGCPRSLRIVIVKSCSPCGMSFGWRMSADGEAVGSVAGSDFHPDPRLGILSCFALLIGALSTVGAMALLSAIRLFTNLFFFQSWSLAARSPAAAHVGAWVVLIPAVGGLIVGLMARFGSDKIRGHGIPEAIEAILYGKSRMSPKVAVLKPLSSAIAIGSGGPFGAEGPIIMTGGAAASLLAQAFHLTAAERKALLVAGACAGMTAVFGTPLAAILLAVELLLFELRPRSLLPVALSCAVAGFLRPLWAGPGVLFPLQTAAPTVLTMVSCLLAGLASGSLAALMTHLLYRVEDTFERLPVHWMWWPALGGLVVGLGGLLQPRALGVGYDVIGDLLNARLSTVGALSLVGVKLGIWAVALGSGTSGGVLAPLLMIGAGLGSVLGAVLPGGNPELWALICMTATLGGTMRAPLTAVAFAFGLTHDVNALLPSILSCAVAYGLTVKVMPRSILTEKIARRGRHVFREYGVDPLERHFVADVMTREPVTVPADMRVKDVMTGYFGLEQRHRAYPVVQQGRLLGLIDRTTLAAAHGAALERPVADLFLGAPPDIVLPASTCRAAAQQLAFSGQERLAVVADIETLKLVGIVSRSDLVKPARTVHEEEVLREQPLSFASTSRG
jgi:chloride channel protein, CIC family